MILYNTSIAGRDGKWHIQFIKDRIVTVTGDEKKLTADETLQLDDAICLPGLINSHDHLDFNLFPPLRDKIYTNYNEWGPSIQLNHKELIQRVLKVPEQLRIQWGVYKNLLTGFTTVVNHGKKLMIPNDLVDVHQDFYTLHSPGFEKNWKWKLNNPFRTKKPFVMHLGEGTDEKAQAEIDKVARFNFFKKNIIAIHGVAMKPGQASSFKGLVWCPASNFFLLDQTADIGSLKKKMPIVFGTDSSLTASWNTWDHFKELIDKKIVSSEELLAMLGPIPAALWKLDDRGRIEEGLRADILVLEKTKEIFASGPPDIRLLIKNGRILLVDQSLLALLKLPVEDFSFIRFGNSVKAVSGPLGKLTKDILAYFPEANIPFELVN